MSDSYNLFLRNTEELETSFQNYMSSSSTRSADDITTLYLNTNLLNYYFTKMNNNEIDFKNDYPHFYKKYGEDFTFSAVEVDDLIGFSILLTNDNFASFLYTKDSLSLYYDAISTDAGKRDNPRQFLERKIVGIDVDPSMLFSEFEYYLSYTESTNNLSNTSFCQMAKNVFATIDAFTEIWNNIEALAGKIPEIIDTISKATLDSLLDNVLKYVERKFKEVQNRIEQMIFGDIMSDDISYSSHVKNRIGARALKLKEDANEFFSGNVLEKIINKIKSMISYVVSLFEECKYEEMEYIVYKFCQLTDTLDAIFDAEISPIKKMIIAQKEINLSLQTASSQNTIRAVNAGALRFEPQTYNTRYSSEVSRMQTESKNYSGNYSPPMSFSDIDGITPWNDGKGDSRVGFQGRWLSVLGSEGWNRVDPDARRRLMMVQKEMGIRLLVNSGYRPKWYNSQLSGSAKNSYHMQGKAMDITWDGFRGSSTAYKSRFIEICRAAGFRGFGGYDGFIHIDIGPERRWGIVY